MPVCFLQNYPGDKAEERKLNETKKLPHGELYLVHELKFFMRADKQ
jgi:hypothetical protein